MYVVGADENGLGPRLGPLVASAVLLEVRGDPDPAALRALGLSVGVGDSKQTSGFGRMAWAESVALALVARCTGSAPADVDALLDAVAPGGTAALRAPCPTRGASARACWSEPVALPAFGGDPAAGAVALERLAAGGATPRLARSSPTCAGVLNAELDRGRHKLLVDLHAFERLVLEARAAAGADVEAVCGMVGGLRRYGERFRHFALHRVVREDGGECAYDVPGVGRVRFVVDADDAHLPVALASMLGKYVRELLMHRTVRFYRGHDGALPEASGYHDPVTARFVDGTAALRRRLRVAPDCFERRG